MKRAFLLVTTLIFASALSVTALAAEYSAKKLFSDFNAPVADANADGSTIWWTNDDPGSSVADGVLTLSGGSGHWAAGIDTGTDWDYLVLKVKGDAIGFGLAPGGAFVGFDSLVGADGNALPALSSDWQEWVVDIGASGLTRDPGLHINIDPAGGTLYIDEIYYASKDGAPVTTTEPAEPELSIGLYPDKVLVDDFNRAGGEDADISGLENSAGNGVWWQNWDNADIVDNALVLTANADGAHFGSGVNIPVAAEEGNYKYLVLSVKGSGVEGFGLAPGGSFVGLDDLVGTLPALTNNWQYWVVDVNESGLKRDQGFHVNISAGTLYIDEIYYANTPPPSAATVEPGKVNPPTGDASMLYAAFAAIIFGGAGLFGLRRKQASVKTNK
ncbi:hypothetical protein FACS189490_05640 [Clostridia bacterium]|nr:hypothetical protein FACS189490_05640 [Clostridia bacterium]